MNYSSISKGLYASGVLVMIIVVIVAISQGWSRSEFWWILIPGFVLGAAAYAVNKLADKQEKERVSNELETKAFEPDKASDT